jgi:hypothetical protein
MGIQKEMKRLQWWVPSPEGFTIDLKDRVFTAKLPLQSWNEVTVDLFDPIEGYLFNYNDQTLGGTLVWSGHKKYPGFSKLASNMKGTIDAYFSNWSFTGNRKMKGLVIQAKNSEAGLAVCRFMLRNEVNQNIPCLIVRVGKTNPMYLTRKVEEDEVIYRGELGMLATLEK